MRCNRGARAVSQTRHAVQCHAATGSRSPGPVKRQHDGAEVVEEVYTCENGWTVDEALQLAEQLEQSLSSSSGVGTRQLESNLDLGSGAELVYSTHRQSTETAASFAVNDGDLEEGTSDSDWIVSDGEDSDDVVWGSSTVEDDGAMESMLSDGWSVTPVDERRMSSGASRTVGTSDSDFELDAGWSVQDASLTADSGDPSIAVQGSSRDLLAELEGAVIDNGFEDIRPFLGMRQPHVVRELAQQRAEAAEDAKAMTPAAIAERKRAQRRHSKLRIIAGSAAGRSLYSGADHRTRPMMQKVRGSLFGMLLSHSAGDGSFPSGMRWLDLFAGTGAVGLEGLSRGCAEAVFVEKDAWVVNKCLRENVRATGFESAAAIHQDTVEGFLRRALQAPSFAGGPFDFVSVTPPYLLVSYPELYDLLDDSPLLHSHSVVVVEYSKQNLGDIRDHIGTLRKVRDRKYGRTNLALYAAP